MPRRLTVDVDRFRALWEAGVPLRDIAEELNVGADSLGGLRRKLGLKPRTAADRPPPRPHRDPTPEEIALRAAAIQLRWDDETRERRRTGDGAKRRPDCYPESMFSATDDAPDGDD